jgi:putative transposase
MLFCSAYSLPSKGEAPSVSRVLQYIKQGIYFCSHLLQRCFLRWTQPPRSSLLLGTGMDLTRGKAELVAENAFLRQQLIMLR